MKPVEFVLPLLLCLSYVTANPVTSATNSSMKSVEPQNNERPLSWLENCDLFWPRCSAYIASIGGLPGVAKYLRYAGLQDLGLGLINLMTNQSVADEIVIAAENGGTWLDHCVIFWPRCASYMASVGGLPGVLRLMGSIGLQDLGMRLIELTNEQGGHVTMPTMIGNTNFNGMMGMTGGLFG